MNDMYKELETKRLILRKIYPDEIKILWDEIFSDFNNYKYYYPVQFNTFEDYKKIAGTYEDRYRLGNFYRWGIILKESNLLLGMINLHAVDYNNDKAKLGYILIKKYHNQGYAKEAARKILEFVFMDLGINRLEASTAINNKPSINVLESIGMRMESIQKEAYHLKENYLDQKLYVLLKKDYINYD